MKDPKPGIDATKRAVIAQGKEKGSPNTVAGDPMLSGATLTVFVADAVSGTTSSETYPLPAALWTAVKGGFKYKDAKLTLGPVKTAALKAAKGTFQLQAAVSGKGGGISLVPPNTGTDGCALLDIPAVATSAGARYHVLFPAPPDSTIKKNDAKGFVLKDASVEGVCPQTCVPGAPGCGWHDGDMATYSQGDWGDDLGTAGTMLVANYDSVYVTTGGVIEIGLAPGGYAAIFTTAFHTLDYLPSSGTPGALDANMLNPISTSSGAFGGEVLALKLNVDFSDAGVPHGTAALHFGDLTLCGLTTTPGLNGQTVRQLLTTANAALGDGPTAYSFTDLNAITDELNLTFGGAGVSAFAQDHLVNGACP